VLPHEGRAFISVKDSDKAFLVPLCRDLVDLGFTLVATPGTRRTIIEGGLECAVVSKVNEGRPDVSDLLKNEQIDLIVNTTEGRKSIADSAVIRRLALQKKVCYTTTLAGGEAIAIAIRQGLGERVQRLQDLHAALT
jgi:carbamoyl-phosphate synthase large subunit